MNQENSQLVRQLMMSHGVSVSEAEFIGLVSNTLHELEAPAYDGRHPELTTRVTPCMHQFLAVVTAAVSGKNPRVLDLGCGTGFASTLILAGMQDRLAQLVCADISPHMLDLCRKKLAGRRDVSFVLGDVDAVATAFAEFDLVVTCSVVHHIFDLDKFLLTVQNLLRPGGFYLMMHEPSSRFYRNADCMGVLQRYNRSLRKRKFLDPRAYGRRLGRWFGVNPSLELKTTELLVRRGVVQSPLSEREVRQLVDIHVSPIHSGSFKVGEEGFDIEKLKLKLQQRLRLQEFQSYGFLGPHFDGELPTRWQRSVEQLAAKYPDDGCTFCALWQKPPELDADSCALWAQSSESIGRLRTS